MLHLVFCPNCGENVRIRCEDTIDLFQNIHAEHIAQMIRTDQEIGPIEPVPPEFESQLKFMFLLHMLDGKLPELIELPKLPPIFSNYIDHADGPQVKHMMIQLTGRWDVLQHSSVVG